MQKLLTIKSHRLANTYHNDDFDRAPALPQNRGPHITFEAEYKGKTESFYLIVDRYDSHELRARIPVGGTYFGMINTESLRRLGVSIDNTLNAMDELRAYANEVLKGQRTEEDQITEGLEGVKFEIFSMYELDQHGQSYDGAEFDPEDDFHQWLLENNFAEIETDDDDDDPDYKTLSLAYDWRDRLSEYFGSYFLDVTIANNSEGTALCVEALITTGGPYVALKQFMGRGYELVYSWGALSESYSFDSELDSWLDDMLGTFSGEY